MVDRLLIEVEPVALATWPSAGNRLGYAVERYNHYTSLVGFNCAFLPAKERRRVVVLMIAGYRQ